MARGRREERYFIVALPSFAIVTEVSSEGKLCFVFRQCVRSPKSRILSHSHARLDVIRAV